MITQMKKRKYTLKQRAKQQEETRDRIVEATMALHQELGPRNATVSAIAERAGVQRLTVYRHFPDDTALFQACTSCWLERHPPPDPHSWSNTVPALARCRTALHMLYRYYQGTQEMWRVSYRDLDDVPALAEPMAGFEAYLKGVQDDLAGAWKPTSGQRKRLNAAIALALRFSAWDSLQQQGMGEKAAANLMADWLTCIVNR